MEMNHRVRKMKQIMNKLFKRNLMINEDQVKIDPTFDRDLKTLVAAVIPGESFEKQLETQILEMAAAKNKTSTHESTQKQAGWFSLNTPAKKFSLVGLTIILIIAVSLLVSPSLRVMAENLFSFWKKVDNERIVTPFPEITPMDPDEFPAIVEAIQQEMKRTQQATAVNSEEEYIIKLPTLLPEGHRVVVVDRGPFGNAFLDLSRGRSGLLITVTIKPAYEVQGKILGPEEKVERITIDNITYEYVRGGWGIGNAFSGLMDPDAVKDLSWIDDYDGMHKLRWIDGNMSYYMLVGGSTLPGHDWYLGMNDLVKIASSFQPLENGARPPLDFFEPDHGIDEKPFENIKDISVLEDLVRYNLPEASVFPLNFNFDNGQPAFTGNSVILNYSCQPKTGEYDFPNEIEISLITSKISESQINWELETFGANEIGEDAVVENITLNGLNVYYLKGFWVNSQNQTGGNSSGQEQVWDNQVNMFVSKWYADGILYTMQSTTNYEEYGSCAITKSNVLNFITDIQKDLIENTYQPPLKSSSQEDTKSAQPTPVAEEEYIIKLPTLLPEGHRIITVDRGPRGNATLNLSRGSSGVLVTVSIRPAVEVEGTILGPEEKVKKVTIGDITYEYVRGGWGIGNASSTQMDPEEVKDLSWIDDYDGIHKLRWFDGNMNYYMLVAGSSFPGHDWYLGMNDLVKIASSFQPLENGKRPPLEFFEPDHGIDEKPYEKIKDISVLEDLVNFDMPEATFLPGDFRFTGGVPGFTGNHVIFYYSCTNDALNSMGMDETEFQFSIGRYSESALAKEFEMFGGYEIGEDAIIETILINDIEVQFVQGDWNRTSGERTWDSNQNHFKMVWYKDGLLYNIHNREDHESYYQGSCALTKEDLIKFVEGLQ